MLCWRRGYCKRQLASGIKEKRCGGQLNLCLISRALLAQPSIPRLFDRIRVKPAYNGNSLDLNITRVTVIFVSSRYLLSKVRRTHKIYLFIHMRFRPPARNRAVFSEEHKLNKQTMQLTHLTTNQSTNRSTNRPTTQRNSMVQSFLWKANSSSADYKSL